MDELIAKIKEFNNERNWEQYHSPKNIAMSLTVEVAELLEHFQWITEEESRHLSDDKRKELADEIGDVLIYLLNLADKLDINLVEAAKQKLEKNREKYPVDKAYGSNKKYTEL